MSRRSAKWKRPTPTPQVRLPLPTKVAAQQDQSEATVSLMKQVAEDVMLLSNALPAKHGVF